MSESLHVFDDTEYGFNGGFAFGVKRLSFLGLHSMFHGLYRVGILRWFGVFFKPLD